MLEEIEEALNEISAIEDQTAQGKLVGEIYALREVLYAIEREIARVTEQLENQSYAIRELAKYLAEHGVEVTRFSPRTTSTLVAVALNGDY